MIGLNIWMCAFWEWEKDHMIVSCASLTLSRLCLLFCLPQIIQYQTVRYDTLPLSPISRNRLSKFSHRFPPLLCAVLSTRGASNHTAGCNVAIFWGFICDPESVESKSVSKRLVFKKRLPYTLGRVDSSVTYYNVL